MSLPRNRWQFLVPGRRPGQKWHGAWGTLHSASHACRPHCRHARTRTDCVFGVHIYAMVQQQRHHLQARAAGCCNKQQTPRLRQVRQSLTGGHQGGTQAWPKACRTITQSSATNAWRPWLTGQGTDIAACVHIGAALRQQRRHMEVSGSSGGQHRRYPQLRLLASRTTTRKRSKRSTAA